MTLSSVDPYLRALASYTDELLDAVLNRAAKAIRGKRTLPAADQLTKWLGQEKSAAKLIAKLPEPERLALAVFQRSPHLPWRWDHAVRILESAGVVSAYTVLQELLATGLFYMKRAASEEPLVRFDVVTGAPAAALPLVGLSSPLLDYPLELPPVPTPISGRTSAGSWRSADGLEWPTRLAILWQLAWIAPIKRTQQKILFKKDRERLVEHPLLSAETLDALLKMHEPGMLAYHLAMDQGWLDPSADEQAPASHLGHDWPTSLDDLLLRCARGIITCEAWNELGPSAPVGSFVSDVVASRYLLLLWLSGLEPDRGASLGELATALLTTTPPWNGDGELTGPMRQPKDRQELALAWTRAFLFGPFYQASLIEVADTDSTDPLVRLSPLGRRLLDPHVPLPERPHYPHALLVQPNHQIIVYRQALSIELLVDLLRFAEPRSAGAALTFEITPASIYHGLESGLSADEIIAILGRYAGRPNPAGVEDSIRTWGQKRDRVSIYEDISLFEFDTPQDMQDALDRGLVGQPVTDCMLLVEDQEGAFKNLRITASRDYRLEPQPCVECGSDGVSLSVDLEKSDLMLESELRRFADPLPQPDAKGRKQFGVTRQSMERAYEQGLGLEFLTQWFKQRTGGEPPESVRLLMRSVDGLTLSAQSIIVLMTESPLVAGGLLQHPRTKDLFTQRLGPSALVIAADDLPRLDAALADLGISLSPPQTPQSP